MVDIPPPLDRDHLEPQHGVSENQHSNFLPMQYQQCDAPDTHLDSVDDFLPVTDLQPCTTDPVHEVLSLSPPCAHTQVDLTRQDPVAQGQDTCLGDDGNSQSDIIGQIFNSTYTDTVSSVASTTFLIKPSGREQDGAVDCKDIKEIYFNCGYTELPKHDGDGREQVYSKGGALRYARSDPTNGDVLDKGEAKESEYSDNPTHSANPFKNIEEFVHHYLLPVAANEILSFDIQEITPSTGLLPAPAQCDDVTSKMLETEPILISCQSSICDQDLVKQSKRAVTMENIHEHSSFVNLTNTEKMSRVCQKALIYLKDDLTFGSLASLNNIAAKHCTSSTQDVNTASNFHVIRSARHRQNVVALSISITLLFVAMGSVRNLQSSLNQEGGVGIISMAVSFAGYMLGSIFSSSIVQSFQPQKCIVVSLIPNLFYVVANIYPTMWLMTTVSLIQGISLAIIWNAMSTYITFLSRGYALKKNEDFEKASSNFFGLFCLIYQSYHIIGNLIASLVLMPGPVVMLANPIFQNGSTSVTTVSSSEGLLLEELLAPVPAVFPIRSASAIRQNLSLWDSTHLNLCGVSFCNQFEVSGSRMTVSTNTKYLLFGIYMGCIVVSIGVAAFALEPLNHRLFQSTASPAQKMKRQLISLARFSIDRRFLLLLPLLMYSIMQFGFLSGEVIVAFVTCPLGIHMVGYTMICFGVTASICSYISGILCKYTGRVSQIITASFLNLAILVFMTQWRPTASSLIPYFCVMGIWGISDGIWNCQVNSIMGVVFSDKYEEAYSALRVAHGLGAAILFSYSNLVCMAVKIYIVAAVCVFALVCYLFMEIVLKYRVVQKHTIKQTSV
ncbi:hypothetical protein BsWGS_16054 [Bradybaena similaris]